MRLELALVLEVNALDVADQPETKNGQCTYLRQVKLKILHTFNMELLFLHTQKSTVRVL